MGNSIQMNSRYQSTMNVSIYASPTGNERSNKGQQVQKESSGARRVLDYDSVPWDKINEKHILSVVGQRAKYNTSLLQKENEKRKDLKEFFYIRETKSVGRICVCLCSIRVENWWTANNKLEWD